MKNKTEGDTVDKNFLLVSLEEKKAKQIAEVINNATARKILDHLAKKNATETELSKELNIAISTVHYNLKQLVEANLVVVDEFHYSPKGKEVNHYSLANKYIIIAPKSDNNKFLEALKKVMPLTAITALVAGTMQVWNVLQNALPVEEAAPAAKMMVAQEASLMMADSAVATSAPVAGSNPAAYFLVGGIMVVVLYFVYEWVKKE